MTYVVVATTVLSLCRVTVMVPDGRGERFAVLPSHSNEVVEAHWPPVSSWIVTGPTSRTTEPAVGEVTAAPARPVSAVVLTASTAKTATKPRRRTPPRLNR